MTVSFSNPQGFNKYWEDTVGQFRKEAIDDELSGGNLDPVNAHITGPVDANTLAAQYEFPVVWSIPTDHSTAYATTSTDQGDLNMRVVVFAADTDPQSAFKKARVLGGRIVNNVEKSALVDQNGNAQAASVDLDQFQMDTRTVPQKGAQLKFNEQTWSINVERRY